MWDFSVRASPSLRNPTSFYRKSLLNSELVQLAIAICELSKILNYLQSGGVPKLSDRPSTSGLSFGWFSLSRKNEKENSTQYAT